MVNVWLERGRNKVKASVFATFLFLSSKDFFFVSKQNLNLEGSCVKSIRSSSLSLDKASPSCPQNSPWYLQEMQELSRLFCMSHRDPVIYQKYIIYEHLCFCCFMALNFFSVIPSEGSAQMNNFLDRDWLLSSMYYTYKFFKNWKKNPQNRKKKKNGKRKRKLRF